MGRGRRLLVVTDPGRVQSGAVAEERGAPGFIDRQPRVGAIPKGGDDLRGVVGEPVGRGSVGPSSLVLQRLGQIQPGIVP